MSAKIATHLDGLIELPDATAAAIWLPELSGEDQRLAWTILARGLDEGIQLLSPPAPGESLTPRHWALHRATLELYGKSPQLTEERLQRVVDGSRISAPGEPIDKMMLFQKATLKTGAWGFRSGRVVVEPTPAYFSWAFQRNKRRVTIPLSTWRACGQTMSVWLAVKGHAMLEQPGSICTIDIKLEDLAEIDVSLKDRPLSVVAGVYLKRALKQLEAGVPRYKFEMRTVGGRTIDGIRVTGSPIYRKPKGLEGMSKKDYHLEHRTNTTEKAARIAKARDWEAEKIERQKREIGRGGVPRNLARGSAPEPSKPPSRPSFMPAAADDFIPFDENA
jgi:hypothetical protein